MDFTWWNEGEKILLEAINENEHDGGDKMSSDDKVSQSQRGGEPYND